MTWAFQLEVLRDLDSQNRSSKAFQAIGHSAVDLDISPVEYLKPVGIPSRRDRDSSNVSLSEAYPVSEAAQSLFALTTDIESSGQTKADFAAQRFGHNSAVQLQRHLKQLKQAVGALEVDQDQVVKPPKRASIRQRFRSRQGGKASRAVQRVR